MSALEKERLSAYPVYDRQRTALDVLKDAGFDRETGKAMLRALARNGFYVGPQTPTNAMLMAYLCAYGRMPRNPETIMRAISKARKRWQAMGQSGMAAVLSTRFCENETDEAGLEDEGLVDLYHMVAEACERRIRRADPNGSAASNETEDFLQRDSDLRREG